MNAKKLILAGGSGFLGQALAKHFHARGWEVVVLTRHARSGNTHGRQVIWDGETLGAWARELEGAAAVVNLAGRSVNCRYTAANRRIIMDSRVNPTRVLGQAIAQCTSPPRVWLNASSATIYRHTFAAPWDESGTDFTPTPEARDAFSVQVVREWEEALRAAPTPQTRKVALRTTMVLGHADNSVLPMLCRLAKFGLGGRMGSGKQYVSWIHERDLCRAIEWLVAHSEISGPVNLAAPHPLTNAEMMQLFRESVGMPLGLPASEWMLELGAFFLRTETELILKSRRVTPGKLLAGGFEFLFPTMREALRDLIAQSNPKP
jgi:uncharacterized protein (TIGR01777 family)